MMDDVDKAFEKVKEGMFSFTVDGNGLRVKLGKSDE